jgi:hypothetical protein
MSSADAVHLSEKQIRKRIFLGAVPLKLTLAGSDLAAMREPMPFFAMVPRGHYLPMLTNKLKEVRGRNLKRTTKQKKSLNFYFLFLFLSKKKKVLCCFDCKHNRKQRR